MHWTDTGGGTFEQPPVGNHPARCVRIIDIGTQRGEYKGTATMKKQVIVAWELPEELVSEGDHAGKPFMVSRFYTQSLSEKANLRHDLENWAGRPMTKEELADFIPNKLLGKACLVTVSLSDKDKAKVTNVSQLPKIKGADGVSRPIIVSKQVHPSLYFSLDPDEFSQDVFNSLTEGYKKMIMASPEYQAILNGPSPDSSTFDEVRGPDEDIPF